MQALDQQQAAEILVVDDVPENLVAIESALEGLSNDLVLATSGSEALRYLLSRDFALILLDVQMPSMDGLETARMIRQRERTRHVPIIFITAYDRNDDDVLAAYRLGAVDFLFKPINAEMLRAKASVFVDLQRRTAEVARQARLIKEHEQAVMERALAEQRRRLEAEALRQTLSEQRKHGEALTQKNLELEQIRAELEQSNERLAAADRRKDEFIAVLAHELRNPLAAMMSGLELLKADPSPENVSTVQPIMQRQGQHLIRLVEDLLDMSRISSGKLKLRKKPIPVTELLDDAVKLSLPRIETSDHTLEVRCECEDALVFGDPVRLAQMVANLLSNAARYTDRNGHIWLSSRRNDQGQILITVRDDGRGMTKELVGRVFDMFVQAKAGGGGLGIGLTLVRKLAQMHDGEITAHSEGPGMGSEFELRLPEAAAQDPPQPVVRSPPTRAPESSLRVVLIDDHDDVREMTRSLLERWGHTVSEAANGTDGLALVLDERPDVAIIDIGLPDIEGYDVATRLRETLGDACPRLVAMTGFSQAKDRARALASGFDTHLSKPAKPEELRSAMHGDRS